MQPTPAHIDPLIRRLNLIFNDYQLEQCCALLALLAKWNHTYNLVSASSIKQLVSYHLLDTLAITNSIKQLCPKNILDVGAGAGFPGIPLAIALPKTTVTLIDSSQKKTAFLRQAKIEIAIPNIHVVTQKVENWQTPTLFDCIVSRAFSTLAIFTQKTRHLIAQQGKWFAMKGDLSTIDFEALPVDIAVSQVIALTIPDVEAARHLIVLNHQNTAL